MAKGVPFVQITMLFMQAIFKYCAKYTIIYLLKEKELSIMYIQGGICMISFLVCLALLIGGYFVYGNLVNNIFSPDDRETPAVRINDGVDYVVMPQWKLFLIQLLNIAGLGPIFGAMQGALWGPIVFLWITFGTIFAGGVHDFFSGMMSERNDGASISEVCGIYLGGLMQNVMRVFSVVLLVMVGTVFAVGPAGLIVTLFKEGGIGGIVGAGLLGFIYGSIFGTHMQELANPQITCAIACAIAGMISQIGDLAASAIKRNHNIKDYGNLIPGHGGILDRFDSMLFTAPAIYFALTFLK